MDSAKELGGRCSETRRWSLHTSYVHDARRCQAKRRGGTGTGLITEQPLLLKRRSFPPRPDWRQATLYGPRWDCYCANYSPERRRLPALETRRRTSSFSDPRRCSSCFHFLKLGCCHVGGDKKAASKGEQCVYLNGGNNRSRDSMRVLLPSSRSAYTRAITWECPRELFSGSVEGGEAHVTNAWMPPPLTAPQPQQHPPTYD